MLAAILCRDSLEIEFIKAYRRRGAAGRRDPTGNCTVAPDIGQPKSPPTLRSHEAVG